jgi:hypothetical protein
MSKKLRILLITFLCLIAFAIPVVVQAKQSQPITQEKQTRTPPRNAQPLRAGTVGQGCQCPYDLAANGSLCGQRSAWSQPSGQRPKCYITRRGRQI